MTLHPQSRAFLEAGRIANAPAWSELPVEEARARFETLPVFGDAPDMTETVDDEIAGVPVRIYKPNSNGPHDVIVYLHGGGWVLGGIKSHDAVCRRLAAASGAAVVSVEYRQPPEDLFPSAAEDCFTVCDVLSIEYEKRGFTNRMVVAGDSAGGNLCVAVAIMARDRGTPRLAGQLLVYPVLDASMSTESYEEFAIGFGLTRDMMAWFWKMYVGDNESSRSHPLASPIEADLTDLPPTHVLTAEYDVLRSEAETFVARLKAANVSVTSSQYDGMLHGFIHFAGVFDDAERANEEIARRCREMFDAS